MSTAATFNTRLHDSIVQCISLGNRPSDFIEMLDKTDGVALAKKLVATGEIQSGLKRVKALGRPDLAMESIEAAEAHVEEVNNRPLSHYEWELYSMQRGYDIALNTTTDFFVGWANSLTFGGYMKVLGDTTYLSQVDPNSTAFLAGSLVGSVHQMALGGAAGSGACQVGRLVQAVRAYGTVGSAIGVGQTAAKAWTEGVSSLTVFDYLALAPVAGKIGGLMNRMCFVAGTPVAVGFESEANLIAAVPVNEAEATQEGTSVGTPELNKMEVSTARVRLFKVGAVVQATHRHIWFRVASHWPGTTLLTRAAKAVSSYVTTTLERWRSQNLFADLPGTGTCNRSCITFAPLPLK